MRRDWSALDESAPIPGSVRVGELRRLVAWLRYYRLAAGMSQADVAALIGTNQSTVSDVERGRVNPTGLLLVGFARAVGLELVPTPVGEVVG